MLSGGQRRGPSRKAHMISDEWHARQPGVCDGEQVHHCLPESGQGARDHADHAGVYGWNPCMSPCGRPVMSSAFGNPQILTVLEEVGIPCQWLVSCISVVLPSPLCCFASHVSWSSEACGYIHHSYGTSSDFKKSPLPNMALVSAPVQPLLEGPDTMAPESHRCLNHMSVRQSTC